MKLHYAVRDRDTQGQDYLVWIVDDQNDEVIKRALAALERALADGVDAELVITKAEG